MIDRGLTKWEVAALVCLHRDGYEFTEEKIEQWADDFCSRLDIEGDAPAFPQHPIWPTVIQVGQTRIDEIKTEWEASSAEHNTEDPG